MFSIHIDMMPPDYTLAFNHIATSAHSPIIERCREATPTWFQQECVNQTLTQFQYCVIPSIFTLSSIFILPAVTALVVHHTIRIYVTILVKSSSFYPYLVTFPILLCFLVTPNTKVQYVSHSPFKTRYFKLTNDDKSGCCQTKSTTC